MGSIFRVKIQSLFQSAFEDIPLYQFTNVTTRNGGANSKSQGLGDVHFESWP